MARFILPALLGSYVAAQNVTGTATTSSALSITTSLDLSVDGEFDIFQIKHFKG